MGNWDGGWEMGDGGCKMDSEMGIKDGGMSDWGDEGYGNGEGKGMGRGIGMGRGRGWGRGKE